MSNKLKWVIKISIIALILIGGSIGLWKLTGRIVRGGYSSRDVVMEEQEKVTEKDITTEGISTIEPTKQLSLGNIDFSNRDLSYISKVKTDYYNERITELNNMNGTDMSDVFFILNSYYYGKYSEYYLGDINILLKDYPEIREFILGLDINKIQEVEIFEGLRSNSSSSVTLNSVEELSSFETNSNDLVININNSLLVGVIEDRYFVFTSNSEDLNYNTKYVVLDMDYLITSDVGNIENNLYKLGNSYTLVLDSNLTVITNIEGRTIIVSRGY